MTANVALTDTFDQWRVKTNEVVVMTQTDGMSNFIKSLDTTNSTTNTTGSIITAGGVGIAKSVNIGEDLKVWGDITCVGDTTVNGNLVFGDAATDQVSFSADINSNMIPNANVTFNLGNTIMLWANTFTGHLTVTQKADSGKAGVTITGLDVDQVALDIAASQTTGDVVNITSDALTTGKVIDITADALTTGSALYIDSDSSTTDTRSIASIIQNHASATGATALTVQADAGRGVFINADLAAGGYALEVDAEQTTTNTAKIAAIQTSGTTLEIASAGILTGKVIDITADAATTGTGINMSMDGLTTGSALAIDSDSSSTSTRNIASVIQNHASAVGSTVLSLQADAGRGLFIDTNLAAGGYALEIDAENTTTNVSYIAASTLTSGTALHVVGAATTTGTLLDLDDTSSDTGTRSVAKIAVNDAAATGATALSLQSDSGRGLFIDTNLAAGGYAIEVDSEQTTTNVAKIASIGTSGTVLEVSSAGVLTGKVIDITADAATTGTGINMSMDGLTSGSAIVIDSDSSSTSTRNLVDIRQNHASATGATTLYVQSDAGRGLFIDSNLAAGGYALEVDAEITTTNTAKIAAISTSGTTLEIASAGVLTGKVIDITADAATTGTGINMSMDGLTTGPMMALTSDSASTATRSLVTIKNDNALAVAAVPLVVTQDSTNAVAKFSGTSTVVLPVGTSSNRGHAIQGGIRYNTTTSSFEGYSGSAWAGLGGLIDVDQDTYVIAETSAGADNDDLDFYTTGVKRMSIDQAGVINVGVDDTGYDVKLFGATAGKYMLWDESADELQVVGKIRAIKGSAFQTGLTAGWVLGG